MHCICLPFLSLSFSSQYPSLQHNLFLLPNSAKKREALSIGDGSFPNWKPRRRGSPGFQTHLGQVLGPQAPGTANTSSFTPRAPPSLFSRAFLGTKTFSEKTYTNMESYTIFEILMGGWEEFSGLGKLPWGQLD